jgi:hypothetical protein
MLLIILICICLFFTNYALVVTDAKPFLLIVVTYFGLFFCYVGGMLFRNPVQNFYLCCEFLIPII